MEAAFDEESLLAKVRPLGVKLRVAFLLSIAERLKGNYLAFKKETKAGDVKALEDALASGWRFVAGGEVHEKAIESGIERCEGAAPDSEEHDSLLLSSALDAASCAGLVLELIRDNDPELVVDGASLARDTIDRYITEKDDLDPSDARFEERILEHPLMQAELKKQREDIESLAKQEMDAQGVADLERRWRNPKKSNLGL
jgi:uncharacterized protein YjaG (DUF416 family)